MSDSFTNLYCHIVFSTKGRAPLITAPIDAALHRYINGIVHNLRGTCLIANGTQDHEHILARLHQDVSVSQVLRTIKASSSRWIHLEFDKPSFAWQRGYGAFAVCESMLEKTYTYIARQKEHHRRTSFEDEFVAMLKANKLEFDERYLFQ